MVITEGILTALRNNAFSDATHLYDHSTFIVDRSANWRIICCCCKTNSSSLIFRKLSISN